MRPELLPTFKARTSPVLAGPHRGESNLSQSTALNVLISEPSADEQYAFYAYMWAVLKSYYEQHGRHVDRVRWFDPIYTRGKPEELLSAYADERIDVLGLSCYTWNWRVQFALAAEVRRRFTQALVVVGGPDPDYKNPRFFQEHPYIDAIVVKDGEIPFTRILDALVERGRQFDDIPGLYLPRPAGQQPLALAGESAHQFTGPAEVPRTFDYSPYVKQREYYERLIASRGGAPLNATWETNRGCPYSCSFCDWGSATMSKVRQFSPERVTDELHFLTHTLRPPFVFLADANFGILPRDVEIAKQLTDYMRETGSPAAIYYSSAKNNPERTVAIAKEFIRCGLVNTHFLPLQHTHEHVLECTDRRNIPARKYREVVRELIADGVPIAPQLILGIPGDTPITWKECLTEVMDWGIHDCYYVFPYSLLPNAPAADPAFMDKWKIHAPERLIETTFLGKYRKGSAGLLPTRIIVRSATFDEGDWVQMRLFAAFVQALHGLAITQAPAMYLRFSHGVSYLDFYEALIDDFFASEGSLWSSMRQRLQTHFEHMANDSDWPDVMEVTELPHLDFVFGPHIWLFVQVCLNLDRFYGELSGFLQRRYPHAAQLESCLQFQRQMMHNADYDSRSPHSFVTDFDWPSYIAQARRQTDFVPLSEPDAVEGAVVEIGDQRTGYVPTEAEGEAGRAKMWAHWIEHHVRHDGAQPLLTNIRLRRPAVAG